MLISFEVKNFLSFGAENTSFTMETGKARGKRNHVIFDKKIKLLRFSAIYGANSSGKSNMVKAINFAKGIVVNGFAKDMSVSQFYNRTNVENSEKNTEFKFEFKLNNKVYIYEFAVFLKNRKVVFESLHCNEKCIFSRDIEKSKFYLDIKCSDKDKTNKTEMYFDTVKDIDTVLFLKDMNLNKGSIYEVWDEINIFNDIYNIFKRSIKIVTPSTRVSDMNILFTEQNKVEDVLKEFGFDITELSYKEDNIENVFKGVPQEIVNDIMEEINENLGDDNKSSEAVLHSPDGIIKFKYEDGDIKILTLRCVHGGFGEFSLSEESDGLRRLLDLIDIILNPSDGDIYIVDEIDRSLNALLTKEFIDYYLNRTINQNVQLIITTHETRLLDLDMLRKDEIWMFDKVDGNTQITALTDYDGTIRSDVKLDTAYIDGRYGGVPKIKRGESN